MKEVVVSRQFEGWDLEWQGERIDVFLALVGLSQESIGCKISLPSLLPPSLSRLPRLRIILAYSGAVVPFPRSPEGHEVSVGARRVQPGPRQKPQVDVRGSRL